VDLVGEEGRAGSRRRGGAAGQRDRSRGGVGGSTDGGSREAQAWGGEGRGGERRPTAGRRAGGGDRRVRGPTLDPPLRRRNLGGEDDWGDLGKFLRYNFSIL